jgi:ABC-type nitrate/sulfonate/bicarbonate transport system substrate-binding protein
MISTGLEVRPHSRTALARSALVVAAVAVTAFATACSSSGGPTGGGSGGSGKSVGSLTLPNSAQAVYMPLYIGVKRGFFKQQGIDATLQAYPSGVEQLEAVLTGQSDVAGNGQYNIPPLAAQGGHVKIIGEYATSGKQFGVVANSKITKPEDLIGKTVATQSPSSLEYYYHLYTKKYGLDESKIHLKNIKFTQLIPALKNGNIDAYFANEPFLTQGLASVPNSHILERSGDAGVFELHVYLAASPKLYDNPKLADAFLRGLDATIKWMNANVDEVASTYYSDMGTTSAADAKTQLGLLDFKVDFNDASVAELTKVTDYMTENKIVDSKPDLSKYIDRSFAQSIFGATGG